MSQKSKTILVGGISIAIALGVGFLSNICSGDIESVYSSLKSPAFAPPGGIFPVVWTVLFILMGISAAMVFLADSERRNVALRIYFLQLLVNFAWSIFFFRLQAFWFSAIWILLLAGLIIAMILRFAGIHRVSAILQLPYLFWVGFATALNIAIALMN